MSKRGASDYITKDGIGSMQGQDDTPVQRATAAQLANRKIAQARGRSGVRHRPSSSGFSASGGGFGAATSQSFPPINGSSAVGNGSANASFGGFGSGSTAGSSGFNFSTGDAGPINNPFAQQSQQPTTNGASSGSIFNFGGAQSQTAPSFQFGGSQSQQPAQSVFGASQSQAAPVFGGFGASQQQPSTSMFSTPASQPASTGGFGGFGVAAPAPATSSSNIFGGTFGQLAAPSTSTPAPAPAPAFGGFGQTAPASDQANGDSMMRTTPESSPQKKLGWNKDTANGVASTDNNGGESPDRPPHVEHEGGDRQNPFQNIQRAPPPAPIPKPAELKPASTPLFSFGKTAAVEKSPEPAKQPEQEKGNHQPSIFSTRKQTDTEQPANPFKSLPRMAPAEQPSFQAPTPQQADKPKATTTPSLFANAMATSQGAASPAKPSLFNPSTTLSNFGKPVESTSATEPTPEPVRIQWGKADTPSKPADSLFSMPAPAYQPPAPRSPPKGFASTQPPSVKSTMFQHFLPELLREDNMPAPEPQRGLNAEEQKHWYQNLKIDRLNQFFSHILSKIPRGADLSPAYNEYVSLMAEVMKATEGTRLSALTALHGETEGQKLYDQEQGRLPLEGTNKRKAAPPEEPEQEKRSKPNGDAPATPTAAVATAPETASKFQSIFESSAQGTNGLPTKSNIFSSSGTSNIFAAQTPTLTPAKSNNLFGRPTTSSEPAPLPAKNLFGAPTATPTATSTTNTFGNTFGQTPATVGANNSGLFSKESISLTASAQPAPAPSAGFQFKPASSSSADASKPPAFSGFKPSLSSATSTSAAPSFGASGASGSFLTQFAKSAEESAKEAKKKAMLEDYDSDEETKEEWSARYDRQQEEKKKKLAASTPSSFKFTPTSSVAGSNAGSSDEAEPKGIASFLAPPAASSIFSGISRTPSPVSAASPTGSVLDIPRSTTPGQLSKDNPFTHLSRQASEKGDADDEGEDESADGDEQSLDGGNTEGYEEDDAESTPKTNGLQKRTGPFEEDSEESQPQTPKAAEERKDGLFGRVSRDPPSGDRTPLATTGANTNSVFSTAAPTTSIWTPKDPIKFATKDTSSEGERDNTAKKPLFSFTPIGGAQPQQSVFSGLFSGTQGASTTTSGAATPSHPFANLSAPTPKLGTSTLLAPPSGTTSVFSTPGWNSRASSVAPSDMSGAESTAGEGEEAKPDAQIDIADLAKDKEGREVIFESSKVKATRFDKADEEKDRKEGWHVVGVGPIAILKDEESSIVTLLMRATPSGKVILNTRMAGILKAEVMKKRARIIIVSKAGPEPHLISFQTEDDCTAFVEACRANGAK